MTMSGATASAVALSNLASCYVGVKGERRGTETEVFIREKEGAAPAMVVCKS